MSNDLVKKNTVLNALKSICSLVFPLITFPYISRMLLADNIGKISFGQSIVSYFSLAASLGVTTYALKECSRNKGNRRELSKVASEIFSINMCSTLIAYLVLIAVLLFCGSLRDYRMLIVIQSSSILFSTLGAEWVNSAMEDFKYITIRSIGFQLISIILMLIFVRRPDDYIVYVVIALLSSSGGNMLNIFYRKRYCDIHFTVNMNIKKHLLPIVTFFSMILAQQIYVNSDITILGLVRGDFEVGLYSTSVKIYNMINVVIASVTTVIWPQIAEAYKNHNQDDINRLAKYSLNFIMALGLPCIVGVNVIAKEVILLIAGKEYLKATTSLHILTIALLFSFIGGWVGNTNFLPNGKEKICLIASLCAAITNLVLNLMLIPIWGLNAAALTTAIAEGVSLIVLFANYDKNMRIVGLIKMLKGPLLGSFLIIVASMIARLCSSKGIVVCSITVTLGVFGYFGALLLVKDEFLLAYIFGFMSKLKRGEK